MNNSQECYDFAHSSILSLVKEASRRGYNCHELLFYIREISDESIIRIDKELGIKPIKDWKERDEDE